MNLLTKTIIFLLAALSSMVAQGQEQNRDRRAELEVRCHINQTVSESGRLWLVSNCGKVLTANNVHTTWHTAIQPPKDRLAGPTFERVAAFGDEIAVVAGFIPRQGKSSNPRWDYELVYDFVLRTTDRGMTFDTVFFGEGEHWINGFCYHSDGRIWMGSAQSTRPGALFFSADSGRSFTTLRRDFDTLVKIWTIEMLDSLTGFIGTYENQLYLTTDNWRTFRRLPTPKDQLGTKTYFKHSNINSIRIWNNTAYIIQDNRMFTTSLSGTPEWHPEPMKQCVVDHDEAAIWYIDDSGRLERRTMYCEETSFDVAVNNLIRVVNGDLYASIPSGVLRISPAGKIDTCGYYTTQQTIEEGWNWLKLAHGQQMWASDHRSVYLTDNKGWYRIAQTPTITDLSPDPTSDVHIILSLADGTQRRIDTAGHTEPFRFDNPLESFISGGLQSVTIETFSSSCYHYIPYRITYRRNGDELYEAEKNFDSGSFVSRYFPVAQVEEALRHLSLHYDANPTASDFGLKDSTVDVNAILRTTSLDWSTSGYGYEVILVNALGDTVRAKGSCSAFTEIGHRARFPWLLPMHINSRTASFRTYQPCLWQALKPLMPDGMLLKKHLDNRTLKFPYKFHSGDLLFCSRQRSDMEKAIGSSTGEYTHVAIVEVDSTGRVWIIEASSGEGVQRIPYYDWIYRDFSAFRLTVPFDTAAVIARAKSFIGQPYDDSFLPDNGSLYCSELVYEAFLDSSGKHLFENQPMNFRDKNGKMPKYWKRHFRKLGIPIPEGVPGTNPTDMAKSKLLNQVL